MIDRHGSGESATLTATAQPSGGDVASDVAVHASTLPPFDADVLATVHVACCRVDISYAPVLIDDT